MTADQYVMLHLLAGESGVTQQTLVARASSDPSTVRSMLLLLEGRGLVTRERHPVDGRARSVSITNKGLKIYRRLRWAFEPFLAQLVSDFQQEEVQALQGLLRRIPAVLVTGAAKELAQIDERPPHEPPESGGQQGPSTGSPHPFAGSMDCPSSLSTCV